MKQHLLLTLLIALMTQTIFAQSQSTFNYNGQEKEEVILDEEREVTLYRTELQDSTCTRQIPYTEEVCGNETFYRSECSWVPGRNHCYDDSDYVCRNVTRYRRECTAGPSREVCKNEPARRVCRTRNGVERCVDVPGRRYCRQVAGPETCNRVSYTDRECETVTRRECDWIPGQNECSQVPYQEWVCNDVTRYRSEQYACQVPVQIPYQVTKEFKSIINFNFKDTDKIGNAEIKVFRNELHQDVIKFSNNNEDSYIQLENMTKTVVSDSDELEVISYVTEYSFGSIKKLISPLTVNMKSLWMNKAGAFALQVVDINKLKDVKIQISVKKKSRNSSHFSKTFDLKDFKMTEKNLTIDLSNHGFKRLKGTFGSGVKIITDVKLIVKKPTNLVHDLKIKFKKNKSFSLKVYKKK